MGEKGNSHGNHMWMMILGCAAMFGGFALLRSSGSGLSSSNWAWLLILMCPIMHLFMMKGHNHDSDDE
jgi:hypothetical protein